MWKSVVPRVHLVIHLAFLPHFARTPASFRPSTWSPSAGSRREAVVKWALFLVVACFLFYAPWVYALPLTSEGHERRRWLKRWN